MKCNNCKNRPWKECCTKCKELEYRSYICESVVEVNKYIGHLEEHYKNPNLFLTCNISNVYKHLSFDLEMQNVNCGITFIDIDLVILEINLENMFINIISANELRSWQAKQFPLIFKKIYKISKSE